MPLFGFIAQILISLVLSVVAYALMPRPKQPKPEAFRDLENPTAEAGRPVPVVFGTITVKSPNLLWYGDKHTESENIKG